jgi:hypothetical protein
MHAAVWVVCDDTGDGVFAQTLREVKTVVEGDCGNIVVVKDDGKFERPTDGASEVVRISTFDIALSMYGRLRTFLTSTKDFESIEFATSCGPTRARNSILVVSILQQSRNSSVQEPPSWRIGQHALVIPHIVGVVHLKFNEKGLVLAIPSVSSMSASLRGGLEQQLTIRNRVWSVVVATSITRLVSEGSNFNLRSLQIAIKRRDRWRHFTAVVCDEAQRIAKRTVNALASTTGDR